MCLFACLLAVYLVLSVHFEYSRLIPVNVISICGNTLIEGSYVRYCHTNPCVFCRFFNQATHFSLVIITNIFPTEF